mgnify:CR=1 FL=1
MFCFVLEGFDKFAQACVKGLRNGRDLRFVLGPVWHFLDIICRLRDFLEGL